MRSLPAGLPPARTRLLGLLLLLVLPLLGGALPPHVTVAWEPVGSGFSAPLGIVNDGVTDTLWIVEQGGSIRGLDPGTGAITGTLLQIPAGQIVSGGERGLLGLAFPPDYATTGRFYTNHTRSGDGATVITRWTVPLPVSPGTPGAPATGEPVLVVGQPGTNHNGGQMLYGPDGMLWIFMGDGIGGGDPGNVAQTRADSSPGLENQHLLGKVVRIDVSGPGPYAVPPDNPVLDGIRDEVWAFGMRNPWRASFDRLTGDLYVADVGEGTQEEVNVVRATTLAAIRAGTEPGPNFQWSCWEGLHRFSTAAARCPAIGTQTPPVLTYPSREDGNRSITGGFVSRGAAPGLAGGYIYGDYVSRRIWIARFDGTAWTVTELTTDGTRPPSGLSTFGEGRDGTLYFAGISNGIIYRVQDTTCATAQCRAVPQVFRSHVGGW